MSIEKVFQHIEESGNGVPAGVVFSNTLRWLYFDAQNQPLVFSNPIDGDILEDALSHACSVYDLPIAIDTKGQMIELNHQHHAVLVAWLSQEH